MGKLSANRIYPANHGLSYDLGKILISDELSADPFAAAAQPDDGGCWAELVRMKKALHNNSGLKRGGAIVHKMLPHLRIASLRAPEAWPAAGQRRAWRDRRVR